MVIKHAQYAPDQQQYSFLWWEISHMVRPTVSRQDQFESEVASIQFSLALAPWTRELRTCDGLVVHSGRPELLRCDLTTSVASPRSTDATKGSWPYY